jgi:hypothetical protein
VPSVLVAATNPLDMLFACLAFRFGRVPDKGMLSVSVIARTS